MRLIDGDALMKRLEEWNTNDSMDKALYNFALIRIIEQPTIDPEHKKDAIQKFHDYQVEWLLSHCDLELEPQLEEWVVRFLHDTANCYMMEMGSAEGEQE